MSREEERQAERDFQRVVSEGLVPQLRDSSVAVALCPTGDLDAKFCVELGAMIMMDKPIIAVVQKGVAISGKMRLVADEIVELTDSLGSPEGQRQLREALNRMGVV